MYLGQISEKWAKERGKDIAIIHEDKKISFQELDKSINRVANGFKKLGISKGDRVAIMLPNTPEFFYTFYACQKSGVVTVPFNTMYKGKEIAHILSDSGAKAIVCLTNFVPLINEIRSEVPHLEHIITTGERTITFADPESTLFIQAILSKKIFSDLDDAYRKIGTAIIEGFQELNLQDVWYKHRGSIRMNGKKLAGFLISETEDIYLVNTICFTSEFKPKDFFNAISVPPEVKDKILEPLTSIEDELGKNIPFETISNVVVKSFENKFNIKIREDSLTREEQFGYQKQRSIAGKNFGASDSKKKSIFSKIRDVFKSNSWCLL